MSIFRGLDALYFVFAVLQSLPPRSISSLSRNSVKPRVKTPDPPPAYTEPEPTSEVKEKVNALKLMYIAISIQMPLNIVK